MEIEGRKGLMEKTISKRGLDSLDFFNNKITKEYTTHFVIYTLYYALKIHIFYILNLNATNSMQNHIH